MTYTYLNPPTATEVRKVVTAMVPEQSTDHHFDSYAVYSAAATRMNVDLGNSLMRDRLYGQVKRALDLLASQGTLVKIGKDQRHPGGGYSQGSDYYRPEAFEAAKERARMERIADDLLETRWALIYDQLTREGIILTTRRGEPVTLDLAMFERIVDRLCGGTGQ